LVAFVKEDGTIKIFFPSKFGNDIDKTHATEPEKTMFSTKEKICRAIEEECILYTYVSRKCFAECFFPSLRQLSLTALPRDKVVIFGDGISKVVFVKEEDIIYHQGSG
jgi:hypothetical protein